MNDVSVVIPFYNGNKYLGEALDSIRSNNVSEVIVVVDEGSEDPIVDSFDGQLKVLYNDKSLERGAGVCRALGFEASNTKYVAFLDCDDLWAQGKLAEQLSHMKLNNLAFSFLTYQHFTEDLEKYQPVTPRGPFTLENFYKKRFTIGCLTVLIDKEKIPTLPIVTIKRRNDYVMWNYVIKYCQSNDLCWSGISTEPLAFHRLHNNALTSSRLMSAVYYFRFLRTSGNSTFRSVYYFVHYFWYTFGTR